MDEDQPPEHEQPVPADAEAKLYASIVRYLSERLTETEPDVDPGDLVQTGELFRELADAFEHTGGFEFSHDQALVLTHAFTMLEGGMRILCEQASESDHTNAAAKMEWAAIKTKAMTADLETHHLAGSGGFITLLPRDADDAEVN
ncbi:MAG: hypothetical protein JKY17_04650 [Magnetovibrio sp.]|nr:hypothetical protein [Magnetovibrio sp.]MBL4748071.1 hypothetical protein [Magnetovibrio sp.]